MRIGVCGPVTLADDVFAAGFDFLEVNVQGDLRAKEEHADVAFGATAVPVEAANAFVPADHKVVGPAANVIKLERYVERALARAEAAGISVVVFGSGDARNVPEGFDREKAVEQIVAFLKMAGPVAERHKVTLAVEPLSRGECNVIHTLRDAVEVARAVGHPRVRVLHDAFHAWSNDDAVEDVAEFAPEIAHVHVADKAGRTPPGRSGSSDYGPTFAALKSGGYDGRVSVEARAFDVAQDGAWVAAFLRDAWERAR